MLLADIADGIDWLVWSKTKDGSKNRRHPEPRERPGVTPKNQRVTKGEAVPIDQFRDKLNDLRQRVARGKVKESVKRIRKPEEN
jgi:hypothetical protein